MQGVTANDAISTLRQIIGYIGLALAAVALLKFFGVGNIPLRGGVSDTALVAIACLMAR